MSEKVTTETLIDWVHSGLDGRNRAIAYLYKQTELKSKIVQFVRKNSGSLDQGEDTFVDTIVAFIKNAQSKNFKIEQSVEGYLYGAARYIWFGKLRKKDVHVELKPIHDQATQETPANLLLSSEKRKWVNLFLDEIDEACKKVLTMWAQSYRMREIQQDMQYASEEVVRKKKFFCLKKLYKLIDERKEWSIRLREL